MCSISLKSKVVSTSKLPSNVIYKTTSETLRLENFDDLLNNINVADGMTTISSACKKIQSPTSSFQITGVSLTQRHDFGEDSADESHTDDISRITDNDTPSFSEDTCSREIEDNISGACNITGSTLHGTNVTSIELICPSTKFLGTNSHISENISHVPLTTVQVLPTVPVTSRVSSVELDSSINHFTNTCFKIETETYKSLIRGRWTSLDYIDKSSDISINYNLSIPTTNILNNYFSPCFSLASFVCPLVSSVDCLSLSNKRDEHMVLPKCKSDSSIHQRKNNAESSSVKHHHNKQYLDLTYKINSVTHSSKKLNLPNLLETDFHQGTTTVSSFLKHLPQCKITAQAVENICNRFHHNIMISDTFVSNYSQKSCLSLLPSTALDSTNKNQAYFKTQLTPNTISTFINNNIPEVHSLISPSPLLNENIEIMHKSSDNKVNSFSKSPISLSSSGNSVDSSTLLDNEILEKVKAFQTFSQIKYTQEGSTNNAFAIIDTKIEKAMDLVKSHLMHTVREEVEILKLQIAELLNCINQLEVENNFLRANVTPEILKGLNNQPSSICSKK